MLWEEVNNNVGKAGMHCVPAFPCENLQQKLMKSFLPVLSRRLPVLYLSMEHQPYCTEAWACLK